MAQLPLALALADHARLETFVAGENAAAAKHVSAVAAGLAGTLWLWGPAGVGKTHLLQAACREAATVGRRAMYVPLGALEGVGPEILVGLEDLELLALDDVDRRAGDAAWEQRLFVVLNEFLGARGGLLLASRSAAAGSGFKLKDLASRAAGAVGYRLQLLGDEDRATALMARATARGFELDRAAADYLLNRVARDMTCLGVWLDRLDRESLVEQRRVTIPFIRELLARALQPGD